MFITLITLTAVWTVSTAFSSLITITAIDSIRAKRSGQWMSELANI